MVPLPAGRRIARGVWLRLWRSACARAVDAYVTWSDSQALPQRMRDLGDPLHVTNQCSQVR
jgi:hypothetical protein